MLLTASTRVVRAAAVATAAGVARTQTRPVSSSFALARQAAVWRAGAAARARQQEQQSRAVLLQSSRAASSRAASSRAESSSAASAVTWGAEYAEPVSSMVHPLTDIPRTSAEELEQIGAVGASRYYAALLDEVAERAMRKPVHMDVVREALQGFKLHGEPATAQVFESAMRAFNACGAVYEVEKTALEMLHGGHELSADGAGVLVEALLRDNQHERVPDVLSLFQMSLENAPLPVLQHAVRGLAMAYDTHKAEDVLERVRLMNGTVPGETLLRLAVAMLCTGRPAAAAVALLPRIIVSGDVRGAAGALLAGCATSAQRAEVGRLIDLMELPTAPAGSAAANTADSDDELDPTEIVYMADAANDSSDDDAEFSEHDSDDDVDIERAMRELVRFYTPSPDALPEDYFYDSEADAPDHINPHDVMLLQGGAGASRSPSADASASTAEQQQKQLERREQKRLMQQKLKEAMAQEAAAASFAATPVLDNPSTKIPDVAPRRRRRV